MLAPLDLLDHLKARLRASSRRVAASGDTGLVSLVLELPQTPARVPQLGGAQFQLLHGHRDALRVGYGSAAEWHARGPERLSVLRAHAQQLAASWHQLDPDETGFTGFAFLGFAARPGDASPTKGLPNALLRVPELALCSRQGQAALVLSSPLPANRADLIRRWSALLDRLIPALSRPEPGPLGPARLRRRAETPSASGWRHLQQRALERIAARKLDKVVLARRLRVEGSRRFDLTRLFSALAFFFPSCQIVSIRQGESSFVAATPERLLSLRGNRVQVDALAGTASRAGDVRRDGALARALLASTKNLHEHRLVVQAIGEALARFGAHIEPTPEPEIMRLANVQHLWTRISATLAAPTDVFALAERLHPTPATNGEPRRAASAWLRGSDPFERGWYTGAAGTLDPDLTGELWVLLRCAELSKHTADLYAGAGIVAGSDPFLEWRETEHKLAAMLTALQFA